MGEIDIFHWVGVGVAILAALTALVAAFIGLLKFIFGPLGPMLHFGKPELRGELRFYSRQHIISKKGDVPMTAAEIAALPDRVNHAFDVPWFAGLSTRKGHFLFGVIRLVRQEL